MQVDFRGMLNELQKMTKYFGNVLRIDVCIRSTDENSIVTATHSVCKFVITTDADASVVITNYSNDYGSSEPTS